MIKVDKYDRVKIICPACGKGRIGDKNLKFSFSVEAYEESKIPKGWKPHVYEKCPKCGETIGVRIKEV